MKIRYGRIFLTFLAVLVVLCFVGKNQIMKTAYPLKYDEYVYKYTEEFGVDPLVVFSIIKTESGFDEEATSNVGARGLMQIMEPTFSWIKLKLRDEETTFDDMYDAETNIRYGVYLISYLINEFQSVETAVAAYHAGRTNVNGWLNKAEYSSDGITLDKIPIRDTNHYVHKVMKCFDIYKKIYAKTFINTEEKLND